MQTVRMIADHVKAHNCQLHPDSIEVQVHIIFIIFLIDYFAVVNPGCELLGETKSGLIQNLVGSDFVESIAESCLYCQLLYKT